MVNLILILETILLFAMTFLNYLLDNGIVYSSIFAGSISLIGFVLYKSITDDSFNTDYDYLNTDLGGSSNINSEVGTQRVPSDISSETTILPVLNQHVEIVPNKNIIEYTSSNNSVINSKIEEIKGLYSKEIFDNVITDADLTYIVKSFSITELKSSDINNIILTIMECFNG